MNSDDEELFEELDLDGAIAKVSGGSISALAWSRILFWGFIEFVVVILLLAVLSSFYDHDIQRLAALVVFFGAAILTLGLGIVMQIQASSVVFMATQYQRLNKDERHLFASQVLVAKIQLYVRNTFLAITYFVAIGFMIG